MKRIRTGNRRARRPVILAGFRWIKNKARSKPTLHVSVLIRIFAVGPVYDVACYIGRDSEGAERWIMSDVRLADRMITHWCEITDVPS